MESKRYIIGLGSGRCGTHSLAALLNKQHNTRVFHEYHPRLPWERNLDLLSAHLTAYDNQSQVFVGEIAYWMMPYVQNLVQLPNVCFICLKRDREETIRSFKTKYAGVDNWRRHQRRGPAYDCYPKFRAATTAEAIGIYWDMYYCMAESWEARLTRDVFRIYDIATLNDNSMMIEMLKFARIPDPQPYKLHEHKSNYTAKLACHRKITQGKIVFISFYTGQGYKEQALELIKTLERFSLNYEVSEMPNLGDWQKNVKHKARLCKSALNRYQKIVYIDADARIRSYPALFEQLNGYDIGVHYKDGHKLLGGTIYFASTDSSKALIDAWITANDQSDIWDQQILQDLIIKMQPRVFRLPPAYTQIFDTMRHNGAPVIEHMQASRKLKRRQQ